MLFINVLVQNLPSYVEVHQICYNKPMKHCQHCRIEKHFHLFQAKKVGLVGVAFMSLHLLFHVFELLILPSLLMIFGGHLAEEPATATSGQASMVETVANPHFQASPVAAPCAPNFPLNTIPNTEAITRPEATNFAFPTCAEANLAQPAAVQR